MSRPCSVAYAWEEILPYPQTLLIDPPLSEEEQSRVERYHDQFQRADRRPMHRIGGHPKLLQDPMEMFCQFIINGLHYDGAPISENPQAAQLASGLTDWRLLFQVDTDDKAGIMWCDTGLIYFWIREQDLLKKDFENTLGMLQCY